MAKSSKTDSFQLKVDFLPITILRLQNHQTELLQNQLDSIVQKAPNYFTNAPIIVDFTDVDENAEQFDAKKICAVLRQYQMQPIAARGLKTLDVLPILPDAVKTQSQPAKQKEKEPLKITTKVITKAVRAGTQVYAKDADLIVLAPVNAGAEVIADGNIHIYAPLRGRALAGASGDINARIFCKQLEAELISVAGTYLTNEKIKAMSLSKNMVQIFLRENELCIEEV